MQKKYLILPLLILLHITSRFCEEKTDGFSVALIHSGLIFNPTWESGPPSPEAKVELDRVFSQKFHYLGFGGQSFAFLSEDGNYVIKFFKFRLFRKPHHFLLTHPLPSVLELSRLRKLDRALFKLHRDFTSYKIAYEELREEAGLLYLHLNKGNDLKRTVRIIDKIGIEHEIDLDNIEFAIQRKAEPIFPRINASMAKGDLAAAKQSLHAIIQAIVNRSQKGVFDEDPRLYNNLGFVGQKAIFIDIGRFVRNPSLKDLAVYLDDLKRITDKSLRPWLKENHPELLPCLDEEIELIRKS
jgi:glycosyltransferase involved in cell wall biosynthesis